MAKILAIDTSTEACSVAIGQVDAVFNRYQLSPRKHAELLLPMVDEVLRESGNRLADLDAIACCVGPGAFTGLRIAISAAQGLAYASGLPCMAISSLETLAFAAFSQTKAEICLAAIDARMKEVYFAGFIRGEDNRPVVIHEQQVVAPENIELSTSLAEWLKNSTSAQTSAKVGSGWREYDFCDSLDSIQSVTSDIILPDAKAMLAIAERAYANKALLKPELLQPVYLRNNVAKKKMVKN